MSAVTDASSEANPASSERHESELERLDRNTVELLNELRVASTGIQVLFAFLLVVPFNTGFSKLSSFDRYVNFITLLCIAVAATLLIAPSIRHRLLFRRMQKAYLVSMGTTLAIVAGGFLAVGMTGILVLISDVIFGGVTAGIVGVVAAVFLAGLWFALPLRQRRRI
jgi:cation transport ATPase